MAQRGGGAFHWTAVIDGLREEEKEATKGWRKREMQGEVFSFECQVGVSVEQWDKRCVGMYTSIYQYKNA